MSNKNIKIKNDNNPHKKMHNMVFFVVAACLTVQVIEGSFIVPYILVHFGYPDLTIKEICDEMYFIVYKDEERECNFPYPLFSEVEPWKYKDMTGVIGSPAPPRPHYKGFGFREVVKIHEERAARKAAKASAAEENKIGPVPEVNKNDLKEKNDDTKNPTSNPKIDSGVSGISVRNITVALSEPAYTWGESK